MHHLIEFASQLAKNWGTKTLEDLRIEAEREATGIAFESIRADGGQRFVVILCATDIDQIARLERAFNFVDDPDSEDWSTVSLATLAVRMMRNGGGLRFESLRDEYSRRSALALIAADPDSIRMIEAVFEMPK